MGGRGGSSGLAPNVIKFSVDRTSAENSNINSVRGEKWDYREYVHRVDNLERAVNSAKTSRQVDRAYRGITDTEQSLSTEINRVQYSGDDEGDIRVLIAQRRRLRQLRQRLIQKKIL